MTDEEGGAVPAISTSPATPVNNNNSADDNFKNRRDDKAFSSDRTQNKSSDDGVSPLPNRLVFY